MADYNFTPVGSMGGKLTETTLTNLKSEEGAPHYNWVQQLRLATDLITPDNTLICLADDWLFDRVRKVTPIGFTQSFQYSEQLAGQLAPEIGSRRRRAVVGASQGGQISINKLVVQGTSPISILSKYGSTFDINSNYWTEKEWGAAIGLNLDKLRTPMGIVVIEGDPVGRKYSCYMFEQCLCLGQSRGYQAGQFLVVDSFNLIYEQIVPLWENTDLIKKLENGY